MNRSFRLVIKDEECQIEPVTESTKGVQTLCINRNGAISILSQSLVAVPSVQTIAGFFGTIRLNSGLHLITIEKTKKVGSIQGNDIFKVTETKIHQIGSNVGLSSSEIEDDKIYQKMIASILAFDCFYFSHSYDLTRSAQSTSTLNQTRKMDPLWKRADDRFFWNKYLLKDLIQKSQDQDFDFNDFLVPIIAGFVSIKQVKIDSRSFDYILISRRSCKRAGTRYNTRGIDTNGNVGNFNETEQIIVEDETKTFNSFLQTRGSIPMFWQQQINVKYTPQLVIDPVTTALSATELHLKEQVENYGSQILVSLINGKGYEGRVGEAFGQVISQAKHDRVRYVPFDFHHECKNMRWDRLSRLIDQISDDLDKQGYFSVDRDGTPVTLQKSVVRTNCMDCLDRTNVVQSLIARRSLKSQLVKLGILPEQRQIEEYKDFDFMLRNIWADNADGVSLIYSGTGALKTDFTRTGKRTIQGAMQDGLNSVIRYVQNNFLDGYRQDAFDLFLGNYQIRKGTHSPFLSFENTDNSVRRKLLPSLLFLALFMLIVSIFIPTETMSSKLFYLVFWSLISFISYRTIVGNGVDFVDRPKLFDNITGKKTLTF